MPTPENVNTDEGQIAFLVEGGTDEHNECSSMLDRLLYLIEEDEKRYISDILIRDDRILYKVLGRWKRMPAAITPESVMFRDFLKTLKYPDGTHYNMHSMKAINAGMETSDGLRTRFQVFTVNQKPFMTIRILPRNIMSFSELGFAREHIDMLERISRVRNGAILFVGPTGHGKSSTMASMLEHIVESSRDSEHCLHLLTIENPVECLIGDKTQDNITQREVGLDTPSFKQGIIDALRQTPDIVALSEVKEDDEFKQLFWVATSGHLTLGTMHAFDSEQALNVIFDKLDGGRNPKAVLDTMASQLVAIVSQRLIRLKVGKLKLVYEILDFTNTNTAMAVRNNNFHAVGDLLRQWKMPRLDEQIRDMMKRHAITEEEANRVMRIQIRSGDSDLTAPPQDQ